MSTKEKIAGARGLLMGMGGFFAGMFAAQTVNWPTLQKAFLAMGVAVAVSLVLLVILPKPSSH